MTGWGMVAVVVMDARLLPILLTTTAGMMVGMEVVMAAVLVAVVSVAVVAVAVVAVMMVMVEIGDSHDLGGGSDSGDDSGGGSGGGAVAG